MSNPKRIFKNTSLLFLSQLLSYVIGFLVLIYSARYLGVENFGIISLAMALSGILGVFSDLGLKSFITREVARKNSLSDKFLINFSFVKIFLAILTLCLTLIIIKLFDYSFVTSLVILVFTVSVIVASFTQNFYSIFQAFEKMKFQALGTILNSTIIFIIIIFAIMMGFGILAFSYAYLISSLLVFVLMLYLYRKYYFKGFLKPKILFCKDSLLLSLPFAVTGISINIYTWIDSILLSVIIGETAVGLYNASYKLTFTLIFIPIVFSTVFFPMMAKYYVTSRESLIISFEKLLKIMLFIAIPLGIFTVIVSSKIILSVYGTDYYASIILLQILIWSTVLIFIRSPFERLLESINKQFVVTKIFIIGAVFNTILNLILIPFFSYTGAAIVTVLTDIMVLILLLKEVKALEYNIYSKIFQNTLKMVFSGLLMGLIIYIFVNYELWILILMGTIVYISSSLIIGVIDENDKIILKSIIKKEN